MRRRAGCNQRCRGLGFGGTTGVIPLVAAAESEWTLCVCWVFKDRKMAMHESSTLVELLRSQAERRGDAVLYRFLQQGEVDGRIEEWTYVEVDRRARSIAAHLRKELRTGDRALLLFPPGLDFIAAFFGCLYAGVIAVPAYPPDPTRLERTLPRLRGIVANCGAKVSLTTSALRAMGAQLTGKIPDLQSLVWLATDELSGGDPGEGFSADFDANHVAFLQYTSGSTSDPKGVRITHGNVMAGEAQIREAFGCTPDDAAVGWLPLYHDMGLIGNVLQPLYAGFSVTLMSPLDFLARPTRWLTAVSHFKATISGGPDFAYYLSSRRISDSELGALDLSSWRLAFNGAEPVRNETLRQFADRMAPTGFRPSAFVPCYGMAEATLLVTAAPAREQPHVRVVPRADLGSGAEDGSTTLVSCGRPPSDLEVVVVEPESRRRCEDGEVGEIWVSGPNVSSGYWGTTEEKNRETFDARILGSESEARAGYLRTGDLGVQWGEELYVTGRAKDLIIVRGRNFYPQDIERCAEECARDLRPGCSAALSTSEGEAMLVAEVRPNTSPARMDEIQREIRLAVADELGLMLRRIVFIKPRAIPKTSSGKIQRSKCASMLAGGEIQVVANFADPVSGEQDARDGELLDPAVGEARVEPSAAGDLSRPPTDMILERIVAIVAEATGGTPLQVSPTATASALGLDSVMMMGVQTRVEDVFSVRLPDFSVWYETTPTKLAVIVSDALARGSASRRVAATQKDRDFTGDLPLSAGQGRLWVLDRIAPNTALYNLLFGLRIRGPIDIAALATAFDRLMDRHPVLRIRMVAPAGEPVARIEGTPAPGVELVDAHALAGQDAELNDAAQTWGAKPFSLDEGPLMRVALFNLGRDDALLCVAQHHAISDGWSIERLATELLRVYGAIKAGINPSTEPGPNYFDYVESQREHLAGDGERRAYWARKLEGLPELQLPTLPAGATSSSRVGATHAFEVPGALLTTVRERTGVTPFVAVASALAAVLHRYGGSEDFGLGTVFANRGDPAMRDVVGFVANTIVLRCTPKRSTPARQWLAEMSGVVEEATRYCDLPFAEVVSAARGHGRLDQSPLFRTALIFESFAMRSLEVDGTTFEPFVLAPDGSVPGMAKFDLSVLVSTNAGGGLSAAIEYRTDLFEMAFIERMAGHLVEVMKAFSDHPECSIGRLPMLTSAERRHLADAPDVLRREFPRHALVHALVEAQVRRTPDAAAVVFEDETLTYRELDERADALAAALGTQGIGPGSRVAISVGRSLDMVVGLLGILKAGAAYVPVDPEYPAERRRYVLADSGAGAIVAHAATVRAFAESDVPVVRVDVVEAGATPTRVKHAPVLPDALMYMIYTSGSTGKPKGVRVPHRTVVAFLDAMDERLGVPKDPQGSSWLALSSISFDISVLEIFWPLVHGMTVVVQEELTVSRNASMRRVPSTSSADFGLFYFASEEEGTPGRDRYRLLLEGARFADERGFSSVWMPERHFHAFGALYPNPSVTAAAVAAMTSRVALRAGSVVMPLHHPVRVAEEWAVVDNLSNGRVGLSVASGWHANDFVFAPENYAGRRDGMLSSLDAVRRLWRGDAVTFANGTGEPTPVVLRPRPVQAELPFWITAAGTPGTFEAAGRLGGGILTHLLGQTLEELREKLAIYRKARADAGHEGPGHVALMLHTFIGHDLDEVRAEIEVPFRNYLKSSSDLLRGLAPSLGLGGRGVVFSEDDLDVLVEHAFKRYVDTAGLFGTPRSCLEKVDEISAIGVSEIACLIDFGIPASNVLESLHPLDELRRRSSSTVSFTIPEQVTRRTITHLQCTPSLAQMMTFDDASLDALAKVEHLLLGGEAMPTTLASRLLERRRELGTSGALINMYGPTETTIWSTTHRVDNADEAIPIGRPIANTRTYVLDVDFQPCPIGVPGELFIAGEGVVLGYHERPDLDAERFLPDPFVSGERMYRTGDRVQWREDGALAYLGRNDNQVKLRGHRIELGEIENALERLADVERAVTRVWGESGESQQLVAYVMPKASVNLQDSHAELSARWRRELGEHLPAAMVPGMMIVLPELPRTPNGKVDRNALPAPHDTSVTAAVVDIAPPRNDLERNVAEIWSDVLGRGEVGRDQSFFDLGGHSLLMARVHARLKTDLEVDLPLVRLFQYPTIAALVEHIEQGASGSSSAAAVQRKASRERDALRRLGRRTRTTSVA